MASNNSRISNEALANKRPKGAENSGGSDAKKKKSGRKEWRKPGPQAFLGVGQKGFLCTTNFNEKSAVKEALNLLSEYSDEDDKPVPEEASVASGSKSDDDLEDEDIEKAIAKEISCMKSDETKYKFFSVDTGVPNVVFITTKVPDPVGLIVKMLNDVGSKKVQKARYLLRILPIQTICKATIDDMKTGLKRILPETLKTGFNTFQIVFKARYNNVISRVETTKELADIVLSTNSFNTVNLTNPKFTVIAEVLKGHCCLSVVTDYKRLKRFNIVELSSGFAE